MPDLQTDEHEEREANQQKVEPEREIRFATVIYGGVSLAIYINGVVQEMLRLVRSTAMDKDSLKSIPWEKLDSVERVYRVLSTVVGKPSRQTRASAVTPGEPKPTNHRPGTAGLCAWDESDNKFASIGELVDHLLKSGIRPDNHIRTRFVVDILSGTSAGGINAIFLAKALAGNLSLDSLARMWIVDADLDQLLNDKEITPRFLQQDPPPALLNARWMYRELLIALQDMTKKPGSDEPSDLVDDLDLYCTTTDLLGIPVSIPLTDERVEERRYRNYYHFRRRVSRALGPSGRQTEPGPKMQSDDFASVDPFLAFAARCTSSFPFAFEPMELQDAFDVIQKDRRFAEYISDPNGVAKELFGADVSRLQGAGNFARMCSVYDDPLVKDGVPFQYRPFGDGGYLDNKPFTYAIETIKKRHASLPVDRKLLYIEPSPESISAVQPAKGPGRPDRPNAVENSLDALVVLPRYETIRQDIESVIEWNAETARLHRVLDHLEREIEARAPDDLRDIDSTLAYDSYWRLRLSSAADQLADRVADSLDVDSTSAEGQAIRSIVGTWRENHFGAVESRELSKPALRKSQQRFLDLFDFDFCQREIRFLRQHLQRIPNEQVVREPLAELAQIALDFMALSNRQPEVAIDGVALRCWTQYLRFIVDPRAAAWAMGYPLPNGDRARFQEIPLPDPVFLSATDAGRDSRVKWLMESSYSVKVLSTEECKCTEKELIAFSAVVEAVAQRVVAIYSTAGVTYNPDSGSEPLNPPDGLTLLQDLRQRMEPLFQLVKVPEPPEPGMIPISGWQFFQVQDVQVFPILFGTSLGEFESVELFRISPQDTHPIQGTSPDPKAEQSVNPPLRGEALWAFGAFLDRGWRLNDMLRGRLDGAERLITAILPDSDPDTVSMRERFIIAAQEAIAMEWQKFQKPFLPTPTAAKPAQEREVSR